VKTTSDLLAVRSDAYELGEDSCLRLHPSRQGQPPHLHLDQTRCKLVDGLERDFPHTPSLLQCRSLLVHGPIECGPGVLFKGDVVIHNHTAAAVKLKAGTHEGTMSVGG
jgi:UTP--glucose-1-phosphate uridylyltransferase